ncbi:MAG: response regulator transcription factor [Aquabacterium commune]|uniref:response regulator transcription factor n=1 Tax=Aquabacterium TaxID=92793 RepID=UPI001DBA7314|nr:response regulator transcription factor [Aquabacterium sp.]MBT9608690.1 response regulator transcription factor [Aquabacterium sp.]
MKLLLLEDDPILGEGLRDFLRAEGHTVDWAQRLLDARCMANDHYDALLVDWQLPDGSGLDWVRSLRRQQDNRPILMLTARDLLQDRITGLASGADDYLVKPFEPEELLARLHAVHRRAAGAPSGRKRVGDIEIDLQARSVWLRQNEGLARVELTAREWQLLEALVNRSGRIVEKATLEALVGGDGNAHSNVIEVHIANLRRKLGRNLIDTVRGLGYRIPAET